MSRFRWRETYLPESSWSSWDLAPEAMTLLLLGCARDSDDPDLVQKLLSAAEQWASEATSDTGRASVQDVAECLEALEEGVPWPELRSQETAHCIDRLIEHLRTGRSHYWALGVEELIKPQFREEFVREFHVSSGLGDDLPGFGPVHRPEPRNYVVNHDHFDRLDRQRYDETPKSDECVRGLLERRIKIGESMRGQRRALVVEARRREELDDEIQLDDVARSAIAAVRAYLTAAGDGQGPELICHAIPGFPAWRYVSYAAPLGDLLVGGTAYIVDEGDRVEPVPASQDPVGNATVVYEARGRDALETSLGDDPWAT